MQKIKEILLIGLIMLVFTNIFLGQNIHPTKNEEISIYNFTVKDIDGNEIKFSDYKGKVILIVNVASKCGFTPQYEALQIIYNKYKDLGFVILGFPANNFLKQEPGTNKEIKSFCTLNYGVSFPIFSKISVKGKEIHPLYKFLTEKSTKKFNGKIKWNFSKFLLDKNGKVVDRFKPKTKPDDFKVIRRIKEELDM